MESFSWSDSLRALAAPCLSCLRTTPKSERNDLEDLLVDSSSTTDAETLSLHSNPGSPRRKRTRFTRSIRLFGWNLFGRPPIHLPDDDDDDDDDNNEAGGRRRPRRRPPPATISTTTLDSDAAPLDTAAIESHATKRAEEEAARAERRARRRERKERKRAAEIARALEHASVLDGDAEFEGFPGSGGRRPAPASQASSEYRDDEHDDDDDDDEEEGDFGAGVYARRSRGGSDSGRGSDSRSRTSTSLSSGPHQQQQAQPYNHHYISQQPSAAAPLPPAQRSKKDKSSRSSTSKTSSSSRRSHSRSSPSASQSPSLASPVATQFLDAVPAPPRATTQQFEGFPNDLGLHTVGIERLSSGFPSPGFGGPRNVKRDMGAFLANRGDA
ncbi:hypothetical protein V8E53_007945 [Lactarius tabidus]